MQLAVDGDETIFLHVDINYFWDAVSNGDVKILVKLCLVSHLIHFGPIFSGLRKTWWNVEIVHLQVCFLASSVVKSHSRFVYVVPGMRFLYPSYFDTSKSTVCLVLYLVTVLSG